jgi:iron complex transport system permease protein
MTRPWLGAALILLCLALAALSLAAGAERITLADIQHGLSDMQRTILFALRLPRTCMALLTGASLAVSGALMQTFFRNPLAEPYVTGISAGAALGAVAGQTFGLSGALPLGAAACMGGAVVTAALYAFALNRRNTSGSALILLGVALGTFCGSLVHLLLLRSGPGAMGTAMTWLLGRVSTVGYDEVLVVLPAAAIGIALALLYRRDLDCLLLGDDKAASLGVDLLAVRRAILAAAALLATICVAFCGVIAFVGLIVPHVMRSLAGPLHGRLIPLAALGGAALTLGVDIAARTVDPPREIPLTIITSLIGAPFFIALLIRNREVFV